MEHHGFIAFARSFKNWLIENSYYVKHNVVSKEQTQFYVAIKKALLIKDSVEEIRATTELHLDLNRKRWKIHDRPDIYNHSTHHFDPCYYLHLAQAVSESYRCNI
jgi:hypothetical protein